MNTEPTNQPPLLPDADCTCDLCHAMRQDLAAAALVTLIEITRQTFGESNQDAPQAKPGATGAALGGQANPKGSSGKVWKAGYQAPKDQLHTKLLTHFLPIK